MKFLVVALSLAVLCCVSAATDEDRQQAMKLMKNCADELGITREEFQKYRADIENADDQQKAQNYAKCFFQKMDYFDQNGDFQESRMIAKVSTGDHPLVTEENAKQCTANAGDNKANVFSLNVYACMTKAIKISMPNLE